MSNKAHVEQMTQQLVEEIIDKNIYELIDVEYVKEGINWYLRVFVDKEGGITIDDCELISRALETKLDEKDPISNHYILEVSSPGLDRPLKKEKDFERNLDKLVEVKLYKAVDNTKEFTGILKSFDKETVTIEVEETNTIVFKRRDIAVIKLAIDF